MRHSNTPRVTSIMKQDTGKFRTNVRDQFYTSPEVASACVDIIRNVIPGAESYLWLEPAAGSGAFLHASPKHVTRIGLDIDPKADDVIKGDYLSWEPPQTTQDILVFGNPPFGRQSSLAKSFIVKSCKFAKVIAFVLPRSFTKPSMFGAFGPRFHLVHNEELAKNSFVLNGDQYDVPCVFQVWEKRDVDRPEVAKVEPVGYAYVKPGEDYHIAFRRVGGLAGKCYVNDGTHFSHQSHYFIRLDDNVSDKVDDVVSATNAHVFPSNTVGPRSLSKSETNAVLNAIFAKCLYTE